MSLPEVTYSEARGDAAAVNPGVDNKIAVMGCSELGDDLSVKLFGNAQRLRAQRGAGPGPRLLAHVLRKRENIGRVSGVFCKSEASTPGTFEDIDDSGLTGTVVPAMSGTPLDYYDFYLEVAAGGTVTVDGITYYKSTDDGHHPSGLTSLGTATTVSFAGTGATLALNPPSAALIALVNELRTDFIAHFALTSGSVHLAADTTSDDGIGSAATDLATAITLVNQLRAALVLHGANLTAHTIADANIETGDIVTAATDGQSAVTLANDLKTKYNAHRVLLTGTVHGAADSTNVTSAADAGHGTLVAGDIIRVRSVAPAPDSTAVADAFDALAESEEDFGVLAFAFPVDAAMAAVITTGLSTLEARGKRPATMFAVRMPDDDEVDSDYMDDLNSDFASWTDDRVTKCAAPARCTIDDGVDTLTLNMQALPAILARAMSVPDISTALHEVSLGALEGVSLVDENRELLFHDEDQDPGLDTPRHFLTLRRLPDAELRNGTYISRPWLSYPNGSKIFFWPDRRVANLIARTAIRTSLASLGSKQVYVPGEVEGTGVLSEASAEAIRMKIAARIKSAVKKNITNPEDSALVAVDRNVTVEGPEVRIPVTLKPIFYVYAGAFEITLDVVR